MERQQRVSKWLGVCLLGLAVVVTMLCIWYSTASFFAGAMDMYAYNRDVLDSCTAAQRDNVLHHVHSISMRIALPWVVTTIIWMLAYFVGTSSFRRTPRRITCGLPGSAKKPKRFGFF